jgi:hypothetical protein
MKENWVKAKGFENYEVSDLGNVRSLGYYNGKNGFVKGSTLKYYSKERYARVTLFRNGNRYKMSVHRLVAENFIENPLNKECVNHIDGNTFNNCVANLEWATYKENTQHAYRTGLMDKTIKATIKRNNKKVINVETGEIYESATFVANMLNINRITFCNYLNGWSKNKTNYRYVTDKI